jgi:hypothetical protein
MWGGKQKGTAAAHIAGVARHGFNFKVERAVLAVNPLIARLSGQRGQLLRVGIQLGVHHVKGALKRQ